MNGMGGADVFVFNSALGGGNVDTIIGYNAAQDSIRLNNTFFTGLAAGPLPAGAFSTGAAAGQADDRIIYNAANGNLIFDSNGNKAGGAVLFAVLSSGLAMSSGEFFII